MNTLFQELKLGVFLGLLSHRDLHVQNMIDSYLKDFIVLAAKVKAKPQPSVRPKANFLKCSQSGRTCLVCSCSYMVRANMANITMQH